MASSPSVKRIMQEIREIQKEGGGEVAAEAMEDDIFEWYFAIRGPRDSDYEGGIYIGRLTLPSDYPLAPPSFTMLTPSGRFETGVRVCLSISSFHADLWSPSWSVRSALLALAAFMPTPGNGAVGAIDGWPREEVRAAARASREAPPRVSSSSASPAASASGGGGSEGSSSSASRRQAVVNRLHARLLAFEDEAGEGKGKGKEGVVSAAATEEVVAVASTEAAVAAAAAAPSPAPEASSAGDSQLRQRQQQQQQQPSAETTTATTTAAAAAAVPVPAPAPNNNNSTTTINLSSSWEDVLLTALAGALLVAIAGVVARMFVRSL